jgi:hypothetical protein
MLAVWCADGYEWTATGRDARSGTEGGASRAVLSELLGGVEGEPLQVELRAVRILFELLGFLLSAGFY